MQINMKGTTAIFGRILDINRLRHKQNGRRVYVLDFISNVSITLILHKCH